MADKKVSTIRIENMVFFSNGVAKLGNTLLAYLAHTLACQSELVANLLKTLLVATNAEALADDSNLAVLEHLVEHGVQLESH